MSGSVTRECISSTSMQEVMCVRQLKPAVCLSNLTLHVTQLNVSFWYLRKLGTSQSTPSSLVKAWSFKLERCFFGFYLHSGILSPFMSTFSVISLYFLLKKDHPLCLNQFCRVCCGWEEKGQRAGCLLYQ